MNDNAARPLGQPPLQAVPPAQPDAAAVGTGAGPANGSGLWQAVFTARGISVEPLPRTGMVLPAALGADALIVAVDPEDAGAMAALATRAGLADLPPVVAAVRSLTVPVMRRLIQAGAIDAVSLPLSAADIEQALAPIRARTTTDSAARGRLLAFVGTGGSGATTLAVQAAVDLASRHSVLVIDLDIQRGTVALQLDARPNLTLQDLLAAGERLDATAFGSVVTSHSSGVNIVAAAKDILPPDEITPEAIERIIALARRMYSVVVVDLPPDWNEWKLRLLERADLVCAVALTDVPGIYRFGRMLGFMDQLELAGRVQLVANRVERALFRDNSLDEQERVLGRRFAHSIAGDDQVMGLAVAQGKTLADVRASARVWKDIKAMASAIETQIAPRSVATGAP